MGWLSSPLSRLRPHYEVAVVGSGYGASIAAYNLAAARRRVCVLERGRELQPGEYPDTPAKVLHELQIDLRGRHLFSRSGLFDFRANGDMSVLVGCGLGGTSLINANVAVKPFERFRPPWPRQIVEDDNGDLAAGFERAQARLGLTPYPWERSLKRQALGRWPAALAPRYRNVSATSPPLTITFQDDLRGVRPPEDGASVCRHCGDCTTGCNYGAKNSLLTTYLTHAAQRGAELFTNVAVRTVEPRGNGWIVHYQPTEAGRERFGDPGLVVTADVVMLAAGSLGSTEILLRSHEEHGLPLSRGQLGVGFTGNADVLAFGYNGDRRVNAVGAGRRAPDARDPVGACITGLLTVPDGQGRSIVIEEGALPGALARVLPVAFATAALFGQATVRPPEAVTPEARSRIWRHLRPSTALGWSHVFLAMGHDASAGRMSLEDDRLRIAWPCVEGQRVLAAIDDVLRGICATEGATLVTSPFGPVTVHPLGGCRMSDDAKDGVVNHAGQVFCAERGRATHRTLYVCDGAIVPTALGVNPLLTISALAERISTLMLRPPRNGGGPA